MTAAAEDQLEIFRKVVHEKFDTRYIGMIGAEERLDKEMEVLHRTARVIISELMEIDADQKDVPQLLEDLGNNKVLLKQMQSRTVQFSKESKQRCVGVEPCVVRLWRGTVWTSLKRSSVWNEECRNQEPVT